MKLGLIVSAIFWTAVAVWGFWGWVAFCAIAAATAIIIDRKQERN